MNKAFAGARMSLDAFIAVITHYIPHQWITDPPTSPSPGNSPTHPSPPDIRIIYLHYRVRRT